MKAFVVSGGERRNRFIDCWTEITRSDGYSIGLRAEASPESRSSFLPISADMTQISSQSFTATSSWWRQIRRAQRSARLQTVGHWMKPDRDTLFEVEHIIGLSEFTALYGFHIHLAPTTDTPTLVFVTGCYIRLGAE